MPAGPSDPATCRRSETFVPHNRTEGLQRLYAGLQTPDRHLPCPTRDAAGLQGVWLGHSRFSFIVTTNKLILGQPQVSHLVQHHGPRRNAADIHKPLSPSFRCRINPLAFQQVSLSFRLVCLADCSLENPGQFNRARAFASFEKNFGKRIGAMANEEFQICSGRACNASVRAVLHHLLRMIGCPLRKKTRHRFLAGKERREFRKRNACAERKPSAGDVVAAVPIRAIF